MGGGEATESGSSGGLADTPAIEGQSQSSPPVVASAALPPEAYAPIATETLKALPGFMARKEEADAAAKDGDHHGALTGYEELLEEVDSHNVDTELRVALL